MEEIKNYQLELGNFIPIAGWNEYRKRTGAPINDTDSRANYREQFLALYNMGLFLGTVLLLKEGLEAILN